VFVSVARSTSSETRDSGCSNPLAGPVIGGLCSATVGWGQQANR